MKQSGRLAIAACVLALAATSGYAASRDDYVQTVQTGPGYGYERQRQDRYEGRDRSDRDRYQRDRGAYQDRDRYQGDRGGDGDRARRDRDERERQAREAQQRAQVQQQQQREQQMRQWHGQGPQQEQQRPTLPWERRPGQ